MPNAGADGIILKTGELLTATDVQAVMDGKKLVFNYPILEKIVARFKQLSRLQDYTIRTRIQRIHP